MKTLKAVLLICCLGVLSAPANADTIAGQRGARVTVYDAKEKCQVICRGQKPVLEALEDGLAYVLDIPLAMLSTITSPIASCIPDEDDRGPGKRNRRSKK
jgi:hypothetical protein